jgi:hypothetical protein
MLAATILIAEIDWRAARLGGGMRWRFAVRWHRLHGGEGRRRD